MNAQNAPRVLSGGSLVDSSSAYGSSLPFFHDKMLEAGIALPKPNGFSLGIYYGTQDLALSNVGIGVDIGPILDNGEVLKVKKYSQEAQTVHLKYDTWILPFVNIHGLAGFTNVYNTMEFDEKSDIVFETQTKGGFIGYGLALTGIVNNIYLSAGTSANHVFSGSVDTPDRTLRSSFKIGPAFNFKDKPNKSLVLWLGAEHTLLERHTAGSYEARDLFPNAQQDIDRAQTNLDLWYNGLSDAEQVEVHEDYKSVSQGLTYIGSNIDQRSVKYEYDKRLIRPWSMLLGAQYQLSPMFILEAEAQFLGDRTAGAFSMYYRFSQN